MAKFKVGDRICYDEAGLKFEGTVTSLSEYNEYECAHFTVTKSNRTAGTYTKGSCESTSTRYLTLLKRGPVTNAEELREFINGY